MDKFELVRINYSNMIELIVSSQMSIAEIKWYTKPQLTIQEVMKATLLVLGEQEEDMKVRYFKEWDFVNDDVQLFIGCIKFQWTRTSY